MAPVLGLLLLVPISVLFDYMSWPVFHSWGMAHGAIWFAWPVTTVAGSGIALAIAIGVRRWRQRRSDFGGTGGI